MKKICKWKLGCDSQGSGCSCLSSTIQLAYRSLLYHILASVRATDDCCYVDMNNLINLSNFSQRCHCQALESLIMWFVYFRCVLLSFGPPPPPPPHLPSALPLPLLFIYKYNNFIASWLQSTHPSLFLPPFLCLEGHKTRGIVSQTKINQPILPFGVFGIKLTKHFCPSTL